MTIEKALKRAALKWVQATVEPNATEVVEFRESSYDAGGCPTCGPDIVINVNVGYLTPGVSSSRFVEFEGTFTEFIRTLDAYDI